MRADLFRLLILFAEGGVYSDSDTVCVLPIVDWLGNDTRLIEDPTVELVLAVEMDLLGRDPEWVKSTLWPQNLELVQWTMWAKRGSAVMRHAAVELIARFIAEARSQDLAPTATDLRRLRLSQKSLLGLTGPVMLTAVVERHARLELGDGSIELERHLHDLVRPLQMGTTVCAGCVSVPR